MPTQCQRSLFIQYHVTHSCKLLCAIINVARKKIIGREILRMIGCHLENNRDISGAYENSIIGNLKSIICQGLSTLLLCACA